MTKIFQIVYDNDGKIETLTNEELSAAVPPGFSKKNLNNSFDTVEAANDVLEAVRSGREDGSALNYTIVSLEKGATPRKRRVRAPAAKPIELSAGTLLLLAEIQKDFANRFGFEPTMEQTIIGLINVNKAMVETKPTKTK